MSDDLNRAVKDLIEKKKAEMEASNARVNEPETTNDPVCLVDMSKVPALKNTLTYKDIVGEDHPDGMQRTYPAAFDKWDHPEDIPEPDPNWVPDHDTLPMTVAAIMYGHNALIVGPPGTGKTKDVKEVCARAKIPYYRFSGMEGLEPADLLGQLQLRGGQTEFVDGAVMRAVRSGGVWAYDEPFKTPPNTNMALQWLAEPAKSDRSVMLYGHEDEDQIKVPAHPEFRMILCDNARGTGDNMDIYAATQIQDASFVNRMQYKVRKDYMNQHTEIKAITTIYPWITKNLATLMVKYANLLRTAWKQGSVEMPFSFRELETWSEIIAENGGNVREALQACYGNLLEDGDEVEIYLKAIRDVGL